ncbi:hypothetical protein [uncultured Microscilla sp.]|uniref:hypothetical protein n=1 Tax=uncultured Microscilla sp. TaxID=432653 RepID=UPI0026098768|nr:hypothetical protein [uncultured Microscilla sp.]
MKKVRVAHWLRHLIIPLSGLLAIDTFVWVAVAHTTQDNPVEYLMLFSLIGVSFIYLAALLEPMVIEFDTQKICLSNSLAFWRKPKHIAYRQVKRARLSSNSMVSGNFIYLYLNQ